MEEHSLGVDLDGDQVEELVSIDVRDLGAAKDRAETSPCRPGICRIPSSERNQRSRDRSPGPPRSTSTPRALDKKATSLPPGSSRARASRGGSKTERSGSNGITSGSAPSTRTRSW